MDFKRFALQALEKNPMVQAGKFGLGQLVRSSPFQHLRNAALERTSLGLPEKTFIKAMTGGDRVTHGGIQLSDDQIARLKMAYKDQKNPLMKPTVREFDPNQEVFAGMSPEQLEIERKFFNENFRKADNDALAKFNSPYVSTYGRSIDDSGYGRDLKMTFGGLSMSKTPQGMRIQDTWDIDSAEEVASDPSTGIKAGVVDKFDNIHDLVEGGAIPSIIANAARSMGTYEPINIDKTIPIKEWNSIIPREATFAERVESNQGSGLQSLNNLYSQLFKR